MLSVFMRLLFSEFTLCCKTYIRAVIYILLLNETSNKAAVLVSVSQRSQVVKPMLDVEA